MKKGWIALAAVVALVLVFGGSAVSTWNRIIGFDTQVQTAWAQVENQLQRRADLIPNLVETVKGYAAHERQILETLANARARLVGARTPEERIAASNELSSTLGRLLVIVENYPNLKADATFIRLMDELAGTENRLSVERMRYNETVRQYNTELRRFPGTLVASLFGFKEQPFFQAPPEAREAPKVKF
jgi:LemA protein